MRKLTLSFIAVGALAILTAFSMRPAAKPAHTNAPTKTAAAIDCCIPPPCPPECPRFPQ